MNNAQRISKLEAVLARVVGRRDAPRAAPSVVAPIAAVPAVVLAASAPRPVAHVPSANLTGADSSSSTASRASRPPPPLAVDDLPDLDLVETEAPSGEKRASLVPSAPPGDESDLPEFDIPAHAAAPRVAPPEALDLDTPVDDDPIQIDHAPLASATIPPARMPTHGIDLDERRGPAASPMHRAASAAAEARVEEIEEIEPADDRGAVQSATPQRYAGTPVPSAALTRVVPMGAPARARSFRALLERSLSLQPRR